MKLSVNPDALCRPSLILSRRKLRRKLLFRPTESWDKQIVSFASVCCSFSGWVFKFPSSFLNWYRCWILLNLHYTLRFWNFKHVLVIRWVDATGKLPVAGLKPHRSWNKVIREVRQRAKQNQWLNSGTWRRNNVRSDTMAWKNRNFSKSNAVIAVVANGTSCALKLLLSFVLHGIFPDLKCAYVKIESALL